MRRLFKRPRVLAALLLVAIIGAGYLFMPESGSEFVNPSNFSKLNHWISEEDFTKEELDALLGPPALIRIEHLAVPWHGMSTREARVYVGKPDPDFEHYRMVVTVEFWEDGSISSVAFEREPTVSRQVLNWIKRKLGM